MGKKNESGTEQGEYEKLAAAVQASSPYKKKNTDKRTMMSVAEMGELLGLKKTERYWLIHKNYFETREVNGKLRIDIASFEKWYANQIKYKKVTGEEPGKELKEWSYSVKEIAELLGLTDGVVYDLLKKNGIETVMVNHWKRVPKEGFFRWYSGQSRYRTKADKERDVAVEAATISMPEMARLLGITRNQVYEILKNDAYKGYFELIEVAEQKRITKVSFKCFLESQDKYRLDLREDYEEIALEESTDLADYRRRKIGAKGVSRGNGNQEYLTLEEAAFLAKVKRPTVSNWYAKGYFSAIRAGRAIRIPRVEFEQWISKRKARGTR